MSYQQIALANGITEPVNGSWEQAICVSLGITEPVNGSWTQALAQYGPFNGGGGTTLENTSTVTDITYGEVYQSKGIDVVDIQITFDLGIPFEQDTVDKSLTFSLQDAGSQIPYFLIGGGGELNPVFTMGIISQPIAISEPMMVVVGDSYDVFMTMFSSYQDATTTAQISLPVIHTFTATP